MTLIDNPITFCEVKRAINKLKRGKWPGLDGIPPEALKAMGSISCRTVYCHVCEFFERKVNHERWHKSQCIPIPKQDDLNDLIKWQGILQFTMRSKISHQ